MGTSVQRIGVVLALTLVLCSGAARAGAQASDAASQPGILTREKAGPLVPPSVFYDGQLAPTQTRNSAGVRFEDNRMVLVSLVDSSGYASEVQQLYQGYLLTQDALQIGDARLAPGAYGFGFIGGNRMVVMDLGGHRILETGTERDPALNRPNPLQILPDTQAGRYRLYLGRNYVTLSRATNVPAPTAR